MSDIEPVAIPKRGRGRPKKVPIAVGADVSGGNEPKAVVEGIEAVSKKEPEMVGVTEKKKVKQEVVDVDPTFMLTQTYNGTPVAIESVCAEGNLMEFVCLPNYKHNKTSKTTVKSSDLLKPSNMTPEQEEEFTGVIWWEPEPQPEPAKQPEAI